MKDNGKNGGVTRPENGMFLSDSPTFQKRKDKTYMSKAIKGKARLPFPNPDESLHVFADADGRTLIVRRNGDGFNVTANDGRGMVRMTLGELVERSVERSVK